MTRQGVATPGAEGHASSRTENPGASIEAVAEHYDVSNEFFALWLDESRTYSCALWQPGDTLETAQLRKIDYHVEQARARGAARVLDIGCGWGSTLRRLVDVHGVQHAHGLTLSRAQAEAITSAGDSRISVSLESWSDHVPEEPYDAIICVGAFEHFARPDISVAEKIAGYRSFFERCHQWLKPSGWLSLQTMVYGNALREDLNRFIATEVSRESDLPRMAEVAEAIERRFELVQLRNDREDYRRTCDEYLVRLKARREKAHALVGEKTTKAYERFLSYSILSFHVGSVDLMRLSLRRIDRPRA
ncbi:class I SAM-dependent methyltransferase [Archangium violaceum]|uniref:SAM-dependent methyltransferase n=1 Tax=Archangium violaceum TaxID=83451 RepID=UPI0019512B4B|nr:cyclopropane-fatty-acyl-phospholipid synthase family protein [Archangium violaceum]QRN98141.1 class I SAM-dependent methyltransferase [Archangium violaceum]